MNDIFNLTFNFKVGESTIKNLDLASDLFDYFYSDSLTLEELKLSFARLGLSYYCYSNRNRFQIGFTGLEKNLEPSLNLINQLVYHPKADESSMKLIYNEIKTTRKFSRKDPSYIGSALIEYAIYGEEAPSIDRMALKEIKKLETEDLLGSYQKAIAYNSSIYFTGKASAETISGLLKSHLELADNNKAIPVTRLQPRPASKNLIYLTHDKKSVQSHVNFYLPSIEHQQTIESKPLFSAFNQYIGGGFFRDNLARSKGEYRSLAYSAWGYLGTSVLPGQNAHFRSYIGCQSDKTNEAVDVMISLLDSMPTKPDRMATIKLGLKNKASGYYPGFRSMASYVENGKIYGDAYLFSAKEYEAYDALEFSDISEIYQQFVQNRPKVITISGNLIPAR